MMLTAKEEAELRVSLATIEEWLVVLESSIAQIRGQLDSLQAVITAAQKENSRAKV